MIGIDMKKNELISKFARKGQTHTQAQVLAFDHNFFSAGQGKLIPHGAYYLARNERYLHLNTSAQTSERRSDSIEHR